MILKTGDKVRLESGAEGEIVSINHLRDSAIVRLAHDLRGLALVCYSIGELITHDDSLPAPVPFA